MLCDRLIASNWLSIVQTSFQQSDGISRVKMTFCAFHRPGTNFLILQWKTCHPPHVSSHAMPADHRGLRGARPRVCLRTQIRCVSSLLSTSSAFWTNSKVPPNLRLVLELLPAAKPNPTYYFQYQIFRKSNLDRRALCILIPCFAQLYSMPV